MVIDRTGPVSYIVETNEGVTYSRHVDHISNKNHKNFNDINSKAGLEEEEKLFSPQQNVVFRESMSSEPEKDVELTLE